MDINSIVANVTDQPATETVTEKPVVEKTVDNPPEIENDNSGSDPDSDESDSGGDKQFVPFPKKAKNAIARRDREIAKLRAQLREQTSAQTQPAQNNQSVNGLPKEEDFQTYGDYLEAKTLHTLRAEQQQQQRSLQQQQFFAQKNQSVASKAQEYSKTIPDFAEVIEEAAEIVGYMPQNIAEVLYEADDTALAVYNLAKNGSLASLMDMSPYRAAMEIAKAQQQPQRQRVQAPKPMQGASGTGRGSKTLSQMSHEELAKKFLS